MEGTKGRRSRSRWSQTRKDRLEPALLNGALHLLTATLGRLPWRAAQRIGAAIGRAGWWVSRRDRRRTLEHLRLAFPELTEGARKRIGRASFRHHGITLGECLYLFHALPAHVERVVEARGWENVEAARAAGRPILFVTGHCGNWELLAAFINVHGVGMSVVARSLDEPAQQRLLAGLRERFGTTTIERGAEGAARRLLGALRAGRALGMLIDQDTRVDGVWVPFFGRPAFTPVGAAKIALRQNTAVLPIFIERRKDGSHLATFHPPLELTEDPTEATAAMTATIEAQIRRVPEQWVWMHRRWRRQPPRASPTD
jgi:KDO2-lipid IV(A) lauroyltransferase